MFLNASVLNSFTLAKENVNNWVLKTDNITEVEEEKYKKNISFCKAVSARTRMQLVSDRCPFGPLRVAAFQ
jgi:hypothetical protein